VCGFGSSRKVASVPTNFAGLTVRGRSSPHRQIGVPVYSVPLAAMGDRGVRAAPVSAFRAKGKRSR